MMKKYLFKPYSKIFPDLFEREKERISSHIKEDLVIEHVGSTAVPGLGGKGIIDIAIAVSKKEMESVSKQLQIVVDDFQIKRHEPSMDYRPRTPPEQLADDERLARLEKSVYWLKLGVIVLLVLVGILLIPPLISLVGFVISIFVIGIGVVALIATMIWLLNRYFGGPPRA